MAERRHCLRHLPAQLRRAKGTLVGIEQMPNGRCRLHGGMSPGAPKGNQNAFKHGRYTAEAIASRREIARLLRAMNDLTRPMREGASATPMKAE